MTTPLSEEHKNRIGKALTIKLAEALKDESLTRMEAAQLGQEILDGMAKVTTQEELLAFLTRLCATWPLFEDILNIEKGSVAEIQKDEKVEEITQLIKDKKLDQAIETAHEITSVRQGETT